MRIVIATPLYPPDIGKPAEYVKDLASRAASLAAVTVVSYGSHPEAAPRVGVSAVRKDLPIVLRLPAFAWRLWREARGADALWVLDGASVGLPAWIVGWLRGVPLVRQMLMDEAVQRMAQADGFKLLLIDRLQKFVLKKAATVVIPTGTLRQACLKTVPAERISILPLPAERLTSVPFPVERAESDVLALGGSLTAADIRSLLDGFILLSEYFPAFHLRIVGEVAEPSDLADAITQARSGKFEYLGFASRAETAYFLRSATVCLVGGRSRDTHQACTSAYAAETTLVAVATDANREVVEHGVSGLLVEASGESFARAVLSLMKDGVKRAALVEGGERLLRDRFGWEKHLEGFRDIVKRNSKYAD